MRHKCIWLGGGRPTGVYRVDACARHRFRLLHDRHLHQCHGAGFGAARGNAPDLPVSIGDLGVVARRAADAVLEKSQARTDNEEAKRIRLADGELGLDIYNMRPRLAEAGFEYVETLEELGDFNGVSTKGLDT